MWWIWKEKIHEFMGLVEGREPREKGRREEKFGAWPIVLEHRRGPEILLDSRRRHA